MSPETCDMSPETYRACIAALGLTQEAAGELFGATGRTGQAWAKDGPPRPVAMVLLAVGKDRKALDRLVRRSVRSRGHSVAIVGGAKVIYSPDKPLACGARVWIEADDAVAS